METHRRLWLFARSWGPGGLPRHDVEVEGVVVKDDAVRFWNSASVAAHAMLRRMSQKDEATNVFHEYFNAGCCDMRNLSAPFARPFVEKGHD